MYILFALPLLIFIGLALAHWLQWRKLASSEEQSAHRESQIKDAKRMFYSSIASIVMGLAIFLTWTATAFQGTTRFVVLGLSLVCSVLYTAFLIWEMATKKRREREEQALVKEMEVEAVDQAKAERGQQG